MTRRDTARRFACCLIAAVSAIRVAPESQRVAGQSADLTCRMPNPRPPAFLSTSAAPGDDRQYSGTIGTRAVTMTLHTTGNVLSGHYVYNAISQPIQLRGRRADARLTLTEFGDLRDPAIVTGN